MLVGHRGCQGRDGGAVLVRSRGNGAPTQEGSPWVFPVGIILVCVWSCLLLMWLLLLMFTSLNSKGDISIHLIEGLPLTSRKFDSIWVIMDQLTKSAHFIPINTAYKV
jgi:hypothetical protein